MNWTVHLADEAVKQLKAIPPDRRKWILDDILELEEDPFRGLVRPLKGKEFKGRYRKVSGRYRIIFKPIHASHRVEVLLVLLRNERTYRWYWLLRYQLIYPLAHPLEDIASDSVGGRNSRLISFH